MAYAVDPARIELVMLNDFHRDMDQVFVLEHSRRCFLPPLPPALKIQLNPPEDISPQKGYTPIYAKIRDTKP